MVERKIKDKNSVYISISVQVFVLKNTSHTELYLLREAFYTNKVVYFSGWFFPSILKYKKTYHMS